MTNLTDFHQDTMDGVATIADLAEVGDIEGVKREARRLIDDEKGRLGDEEALLASEHLPDNAELASVEAGGLQTKRRPPARERRPECEP